MARVNGVTPGRSHGGVNDTMSSREDFGTHGDDKDMEESQENVWLNDCVNEDSEEEVKERRKEEQAEELKTFLAREVIFRDPQEVSRCNLERVRDLDGPKLEYLNVMAKLSLGRMELLMILLKMKT